MRENPCAVWIFWARNGSGFVVVKEVQVPLAGLSASFATGDARQRPGKGLYSRLERLPGSGVAWGGLLAAKTLWRPSDALAIRLPVRQGEMGY
jgi:hypothetical protein